MTLPLSQSQIKAAAEIDAEVVRLLRFNGDETLLTGMLPLMGKFKPVLDSSTPGQLDLLCNRFSGLKHFAQLLEAMSLAIEDGQFNDVVGR